MIAILIDGQVLPIGRPLALHDRTLLVPLQGCIDKLASRVRRDPDGTIVVSRGSRDILLRLGQKRAFYKAGWTALEAAPFQSGNTEYVPLRAVATALGYRVAFRSHPALVSLVTPASQAPQSPTPLPVWYPVVVPRVVITPTPRPIPRWSVPPTQRARRTPLPVPPEYRF